MSKILNSTRTISNKLIVIAHDIRSTYNIGSLFRTCECLGVDELIISGYSSYPEVKDDTRLPHIANKLTEQINKTALGTIDMIKWQHVNDLAAKIQELRANGYLIVGLEQSSKSISLNDFTREKNIALILGREVEGIEDKIIKLCDELIEIPQKGNKESLNVVQAAAIAIYNLSYK